MPPVRPEEEADAFLQWADEFRQDYKKVAEAYGISVQTAYSWGRKYGWKDRRRRMMAEIAQPAFDEASHEMKMIWSDAGKRLHEIIVRSDDSTAMSAIRLLAQLTTSTFINTDNSGPLTLVDARQVHLHDTVDAGQQHQNVARILSANIVDADEEKKTKPRKTWG